LRNFDQKFEELRKKSFRIWALANVKNKLHQWLDKLSWQLEQCTSLLIHTVNYSCKRVYAAGFNPLKR
jgi:hypothetical protein